MYSAAAKAVVSFAVSKGVSTVIKKTVAEAVITDNNIQKALLFVGRHAIGFAVGKFVTREVEAGIEAVQKRISEAKTQQVDQPEL